MGMSNQTEEKELFHAVSLSGGKDSTAMLLLMIERGLPIDAVLTADTGMEFPEMYEHLQKLDDYLFAERGLHLTWLRHPKGFEWLMFEEKKQRPASIENRQRLGVSLYGNGWPGPRALVYGATENTSHPQGDQPAERTIQGRELCGDRRR